MWAVVDSDGKLLCKFEAGKYVGETIFVTRREAQNYKGMAKNWRVVRVEIKPLSRTDKKMHAMETGS
jgi:hypothetical protein